MKAETSWLKWVRAAAAQGNRRVVLGIGDDAALIRPRSGWELAITTDLFIEDIHFLRARDRAPTCGRRLATRGLSDLAAMGAEPLALLVSSAYPASLAEAWPREFYRGLLQAAQEAGAALAGGDVSASPANKIFFDVVAVGQAPAGAGLRRSGARAGDRIFVSGVLGAAARGRRLAHAGTAARTPADRFALARHRHPRARWELGMALRRRASAAIDISDGLATDLSHLCEESGAGAEIWAAALPLLPGKKALESALYGGEDYELLFTLPPRTRANPEACEIGRITPGRGVWLIDADGGRERVQARGWEHFRR